MTSFSDIVWSYSGLRALVEDETSPSAQLSRDYCLDLKDQAGKSPIVSVLGGKLTTYRALSEKVLTLLKPYYKPLQLAIAPEEPLPGGNLNCTFEEFLKNLQLQYAKLPEKLLKRYAKQYGSRVEALLANVSIVPDLGQLFGADLYEKEVLFLMKEEWAQTVEDIIWRRTKLGLVLKTEELLALEKFIAKKRH